jgi:uncharacterized protein (TIGR02453 family)
MKGRSAMAQFSGFPPETTEFLRRLSENNSKAWFDEYRADYDSYWVEPAKAFVIAAGATLQEIAPVEAQPRVNGSIFRVNRDIRFSADKRPYKGHLDFWFWEGDRRSAVSGFYLRITADAVAVGCGAHRFDKDRLDSYRAAVADPTAAKSLLGAVSAIEKAKYGVKGEHYKTLPRGFDADDEFTARMLRHNALWVGDDEPAPKVFGSSRFVSWAMTRWSKMEPLHRWLVDTVQ